MRNEYIKFIDTYVWMLFRTIFDLFNDEKW